MRSRASLGCGSTGALLSVSEGPALGRTTLRTLGSAIDLLSYGTLRGEAMIASIAEALGAEEVKTSCLKRGVRGR